MANRGKLRREEGGDDISSLPSTLGVYDLVPWKIQNEIYLLYILYIKCDGLASYSSYPFGSWIVQVKPKHSLHSQSSTNSCRRAGDTFLMTTHGVKISPHSPPRCRYPEAETTRFAWRKCRDHIFRETHKMTAFSFSPLRR